MLARGKSHLWRAVFDEAAYGLEDGQTSVVESVRRDGLEGMGQRVADEFLDEYDQVCKVTTTPGWDYRDIAGNLVTPNVMQQYFAHKLLKYRQYGNWSGTGAGKTISAILAARIAGAGMPGGRDVDGVWDDRDGLVIVVAPNNVVPGWERALVNAYPDTRVATKTLNPQWPSGSGSRWLILNYDKLSSEKAGPALAELVRTYRVDMLVADEVHYAKRRGAKRGAFDKESARRQTLLGLRASVVDPDRGGHKDAIITGMTATPVMNDDLTEGKSLLELLLGAHMDDLKVSATSSAARSMFRQFTTHGVRWLPKLTPNIHKATVTDVPVPSHLKDDLLDAYQVGGHAPARVYARAKIPHIVDYVLLRQRQGKKTMIYTELIDGFVNEMEAALTAAGIRVGRFTGQAGDKAGLAPFLGRDTTGNVPRLIPAADQVDVLIGSSAIGTGVDGLQHVCDGIVFLQLPWTGAQFTQVLGRLIRQGQVSEKVDVLVPLSYLPEHVMTDKNGRRISLDDAAWRRVKNKHLLASAAVDGVDYTGTPPTEATVVKHHAELLERLRNGQEGTIVRRPLDVQLAVELAAEPGETEETRRRRVLSEFSRMNTRWNNARSSNTHNRLRGNPGEWADYHRRYREARQHWPTVPAHVFADWLNERSDSRTVADLGCGEMILADRVDGHEVTGFDHVAIDDRVIACDIADLPVEDGTFDFAVLSLALMGSNDADYLATAHRILKTDGQLWIAETATRIGTDEDRIAEALRANGFDMVGGMLNRDGFVMFRSVKRPGAVTGSRSVLLRGTEVAA